MRAKLDWTGEGDLVGSPVPGVEGRIGSDGELIVRGTCLFSRYLGGPPVIEHGTGDLARIDANGIALLGRAKDMIIRGEFNIYPALYEPAFERLPGVRRSAMIGLHDDATSDERVVVVVEPSAGIDPQQLERDVAEALRRGNVGIDAFAHPDLIMAFALPESGRSSKIDKAALRQVVRERLG
jgi:acyl-CoA synthetase (AMP-forming)/AMP-acid ligase II